MPNWRIEFAMAATDQTVDSFECEISKLTRYISKTGALAGSVPVISPALGQRISTVLGGEGRMTMYAYYGEECWWGGMLDRTSLKSNSFGALLDFEGVTFEAYPDRREARTDESFRSTEQTEIVRWLWQYMQGTGAGSNLRVNVGDRHRFTGYIDLEWKRSEIRTVGSLIQEASNRVGGYEWIIDCYANQGTRYRDLVIGYPAIGRPDNQVTLTYPGDIVEYEIEGDATDGATSFQARGKAPDPEGSPNPMPNPNPSPKAVALAADTPSGSERQEPIMSQQYHADDLHRAGYIRMDATVDRGTVTSIPILNKWAELARNTRSGPLVLPSILTRMEGMTQAVLGSNIMLRINDHPFPPGPYGEPGYESSARCIGYEINPGEYGSPDLARIIFENPYDETAQNRSPV